MSKRGTLYFLGKRQSGFHIILKCAGNGKARIKAMRTSVNVDLFYTVFR